MQKFSAGNQDMLENCVVPKADPSLPPFEFDLAANFDRSAPRISHHLFVDDCLLFCRATVQDYSKIRRVLGCYEGAFGLFVNAEKFGIMFSSNTVPSIKDVIKNLLGIEKSF